MKLLKLENLSRVRYSDAKILYEVKEVQSKF